MLSFQPIRSPLAPNILITGIVPSESSIFKSALHPLRLTFRTASGGTCKMIFKKGDDIRQDQLVNCYISLLPRTKSTTILTLFPSLLLSFSHPFLLSLFYSLRRKCSSMLHRRWQIFEIGHILHVWLL